MKNTKKSLDDRIAAREGLRKACKTIVLPMNSSLLTSSGDLAARISAIEETSDREVVIAPEGAKLCDRTKTQYDFYYKTDQTTEGDKPKYKYRKAFKGLSFRTFDDMVYFVGETLRLIYPNSSDQQEYGIIIISSDKEKRLNFFKVSDATLLSALGRTQKGYGVEVQHAGRD